MERYIATFVILTLLVTAGLSQPIYIATGGSCTFFSKTPVEDIDAHSESMTSVLNSSNNEIVFKVPMSTFKFKKSLMQEHFNENYIESEKYPYAIFKGKINETIDFTKDGVYEVTATGTLNMHGVDKQRMEKGKLTIKEGKISIESFFKVPLKDHHIQVPKIVTANIAEIIDVNMSCSYTPYSKK